MITSFPPMILLCLDPKYGAPRAYLHEDAMQLMLDELTQTDPDGGWDDHDLYTDYTVRARLLHSEDGTSALYTARLAEGRSATFEVGQFDRKGAAEVWPKD